MDHGAAKLLVGNLPESGPIYEVSYGHGALAVSPHDYACHIGEFGEDGGARGIVCDCADLSLLQNIGRPPPAEVAQAFPKIGSPHRRLWEKIRRSPEGGETDSRERIATMGDQEVAEPTSVCRCRTLETPSPQAGEGIERGPNENVGLVKVLL